MEPGQLLPPGVEPAVAGPVRLLCLEEARPGPRAVLLSAGDGTEYGPSLTTAAGSATNH